MGFYLRLWYTSTCADGSASVPRPGMFPASPGHHFVYMTFSIPHLVNSMSNRLQGLTLHASPLMRFWTFLDTLAPLLAGLIRKV